MKRVLFLPLSFAILALGACGGFGVSYYAATPPPPLRAETFGVAPGPDYAWVNGYWGWNGGAYAWVPGRWDRRPRPGAVWVEPRWERKGNRYHFRSGHWR